MAMRITSKMMQNTSLRNLNINKALQEKLMNQSSTGKKITRPSDDPVIAIRSLKLNSSLDKIDQYYEKNILDAQAWLEATETALKNMNKILTDVKTECVSGTNSYLTAEDRNTILKNLTALKTQLYSEGNADNAGRTVFTGFRTNSQLTFTEDENETVYQISQKFTFRDIEQYAYMSGSIEVPATPDEVKDLAELNRVSADDYITKDNYDRIRLAYDRIDDGDTITLTATDKDGNPIALPTPIVYASEEEWAKNGINDHKSIGDNDIIIIQNTGDVIFGSELGKELKSDRASIEIDYQKTGFDKGELRPEYYYNCTDISDAKNPIEYTKFDANGNKIYEDINYTVSLNQTLTINLQADEIFDMNIQQDVVELMDSVQAAINAHDKVDRLTEMKNEAQYADCKEQIEKWLAAAQKEADYADHQLTELYSAGIGKFDKYIEKLNIAYTEVGARGDQLEMTETRISNLQLTQEELKSCNEDKELSDIIIEYTAAYNAYQASLLSAGKIEKQTLLDYI